MSTIRHVDHYSAVMGSKVLATNHILKRLCISKNFDGVGNANHCTLPSTLMSVFRMTLPPIRGLGLWVWHDLWIKLCSDFSVNALEIRQRSEIGTVYAPHSDCSELINLSISYITSSRVLRQVCNWAQWPYLKGILQQPLLSFLFLTMILPMKE